MRIRSGLVVCIWMCAVGACSGDSADTFKKFPWAVEPPDVVADRLCAEAAEPDNAAEKIDIDCVLEGEQLVDPPTDKPEELVVMSFNLAGGQALIGQLYWIEAYFSTIQPDVILLTEVDRGCSRSNYDDVARQWAETVEMNYVFGVEFIELPRASGPGGPLDEVCERGHAILSRFPLGNVQVMRFFAQRDWYVPPEERDAHSEPRLGGRMALLADVQVGDRTAHLYAVQLEEGVADGPIRDAQAIEIARHGATRPHTVIFGTETASQSYWMDLRDGTTTDPTVSPFLGRGFHDAHLALPPEERATSGAFVQDLLFINHDGFSNSEICQKTLCGGLSDHLPLWTTVELR